jgi:ribonucleoside-diphosphate reductase alpha chain
MGFLGLGSTLTMLRMKYGSKRSWPSPSRSPGAGDDRLARSPLRLAKEKGPAPIMEQEFEVTAAMLRLRPEMAVMASRWATR